MKKYPIIFMVAVVLLLLTGTASAVLPQWVENKLHQIAVAQQPYIHDPKIVKLPDINEPVSIPSPPIPSPEEIPEDTTPAEEMEFWLWINDYIYNNTLCEAVPPVNVTTLCPFGAKVNTVYPVFPL